MKKLIIGACFVLVCLHANSQEVYNKLYNSATEVLNDPQAAEIKTKINYFYLTELNYLKAKAGAQMETVTTSFLDTQAYYLSEYVGAFFKDLSEAHRVSAECQKDITMAYINATLSNSLFEDSDTEKVHSFIGDQEYLTPFSLDTNWEKAYKEITEKAKEILKKK